MPFSLNVVANQLAALAAEAEEYADWCLKVRAGDEVVRVALRDEFRQARFEEWGERSDEALVHRKRN
jgi:hypothetical protein